jgi:integrase
MDGLVKSFIKRAQRTRTWQEARRTINHDVMTVLKGREVSGLTRRDIHAALDSVLARGSPIQANRALSVMRRMFGYAVERGLIERSPCDGVRPPSIEHSRDRVLSDGELAAIWRGCDQIGLFGSLVKLLMLTGQRRSEIGAMRWSEIDFEAHTLNLPRERVKNATAHCVPLSNAAIAILLGLDRDLSSNANGLVFSTTGRPVSGYSKMKARLDAASGTAGWCLHDLRRTFVTGLARLGVDIPVIERAVNHRSGTFGGVVGTYQRHDYHQEVRAAMEVWAAHISSLTSNKETD